MIKVYEAASKYFGLKEEPGVKHNPKVVEMFARVGHPEIKDDETSWCAAFVGSVLLDAGLKGTGALNARSYLKWGKAKELKDAEKGDIVVFWRNSPTSWEGHVSFFHEQKDGLVYVLGGNQKNSVNISPYKASQVLSVRYQDLPKEAAPVAPKKSFLDILAEIISGVLNGRKKAVS